MYFDEKALGNKSTRDKTLLKLLNSPGVMVFASGVSSSTILSSNLNKICDRLKLLVQKKLWSNQKTDQSRYANGDDIKLVNLGPIALFQYL